MLSDIQEIQGNQGIPENQGIQAFQENSRNPSDRSGIYKKAMRVLENWLELHKGETFDLDTICRHMEIHDSTKRDLLTQCLSYKVNHGFLEKSNRIYRYINRDIKYIDWVNAPDGNFLDLVWPHSHDADDGMGLNTHFGFASQADVSPGDVIVVAGVSNMGKTTFCQNFLLDNMDKYDSLMMGNEITASKFKRRIKRMTWVNPLKEDGTPKFQVTNKRDNWKDFIKPDSINIIDWISIPEKAYMIAEIIDGIQSKLRNGIVVIAIQMKKGQELGTGGQYSEHLSSIYLSIDFERLTVRKVKEWRSPNPNGKTYGFTIVEGGTQFHNIREVNVCPRCHGKSTMPNVQCETCNRKGYVDAEE